MYNTLVKPIKILSFDGGGARCIFSLKILEILCKKLYGKSDNDATKKFIDHFDLIAGTSGGSIIASLLCIGYSIDHIKNIFDEFNFKIFENSWREYPLKLLRYYKTGNFYNSELLLQFLSNFFGDKKITDIDKHLLIIATDVSTNLFKPHLFKNYYSNKKYPSNEILRNVIRASVSAPTYFSPFTDINDKTYVDGGLVANNPTMIAIFESEELYHNSPIDLILSIGTGTEFPHKGSTFLKELPEELLILLTNSELIHREVLGWSYGSNHEKDYFRFSTIGLGSIKLDETDKNILQKGNIETEKYMIEQEGNISKLVNKLNNN